MKDAMDAKHIVQYGIVTLKAWSALHFEAIRIEMRSVIKHLLSADFCEKIKAHNAPDNPHRSLFDKDVASHLITGNISSCPPPCRHFVNR